MRILFITLLLIFLLLHLFLLLQLIFHWVGAECETGILLLQFCVYFTRSIMLWAMVDVLNCRHIVINNTFIPFELCTARCYSFSLCRNVRLCNLCINDLPAVFHQLKWIQIRFESASHKQNDENVYTKYTHTHTKRQAKIYSSFPFPFEWFTAIELCGHWVPISWTKCDYINSIKFQFN